MPELPEVETIVRDLRQNLVGNKISGVHFLTRSVWREKTPLPKRLKAVITDIKRRGKNILIYLSNGQVLIVHLKMTGRLTIEDLVTPLKKHTHFIMDLSHGRQVRFNDIRRFGYLDLVRESELENTTYLASLGPDALEISRDGFVELIRSKKRIIKSLLLDQSVISGLGNIYSDEALFFAGIHPRRVSASIGHQKAGRLYDAMIDVLNRALDARGSSIDDYVDARGNKGSFQNQHHVYGREGEACKKCGKPIRREVIGSRSAHFCRHCQR